MAYVALLLVVALVFLMVSSLPKQLTCTKCGFKGNELECAGHEKLENTHKCA